MAADYSGVGHRTTELVLTTYKCSCLGGEPHEPGKVISGEQLLHPPDLTCRFSQGFAGVAHLQRFQPVRWVSVRPPIPPGMGGWYGYPILSPTYFQLLLVHL
ncbi:hypothetical protein ILYODFUR_037033 [Ilyodon furcidens]|uniref:Uncharacterized protein n=1 Tax=Ilyodon furcidens TaxID=33524 RepID=A0ABV0STY4_9TELE